jgi:nucleoside-diphosphate-sugar epimerase
LVHCAYDFNQTKWQDIYKTNVLGSKKTFKIGYESKIKKIVNISTVSAYPEAISLYGKAKYKIEKLSENYNVINLRCGLVNSNKSKLLNRIRYFAKKFYIFPLIGDGNLKIHLCNLEDIAHFIEKIQASKIVLNKKIFYICNPNYIFLKNLITSFSKKKIYIKIPIIFVKIFLKITDLMKLPIGFTYDNLLGLINYNPKLVKKIIFRKKI